MTLMRKIDTDNMIAKGGKILEEKPEWIPLTVNVMPKMVDRIDQQRERGISRNLWIRQAIQEKLKRDEENGDLI